MGLPLGWSGSWVAYFKNSIGKPSTPADFPAMDALSATKISCEVKSRFRVDAASIVAVVGAGNSSSC